MGLSMNRIMMLVFISLCLGFKLYSQWQPVNGPDGGTVNCLNKEDSGWLVGLDEGGVYKSIDNGLNWVSLGLDNDAISSIQVIGEHIFAVGYGQLFLTTNDGQSWQRLASNISAVSAVTISKGYIFMGTYTADIQTGYHGELYLSSDSGATWQPQNIPSAGMFSIYVEGSTVFVFTSKGLYRSINFGASWQLLNQGTSVPLNTNSFLATSKYLFAVASNMLYSCSASDSSWKPTAWDSTKQIGLTTVENDTIVILSQGWIFSSSDNGVSWIKNQVILPDNNVRTMLIDNSAIMLGIDRNGVLVSFNRGSSWNFVKSGLKKISVSSFESDDSALYAATSGGFYYSKDGGASWQFWNIGYDGSGINKIKTINSTDSSGSFLLMATQGGLFKTSMVGNSWKLVSPQSMGSVMSLAVNGGKIYAGTGGITGNGVYISTNQGTSWYPYNKGLNSYGSYGYKTISAFSFSNDTILLGSYEGVYESAIDNISWNLLTQNFPEVYSITNYAGLTYIGSGGGAICGSFSTGTWNAITGAVTYCVKAIGQSVFVCGWGQGVFLSSDGGMTWNTINTGLTDYYNSDITLYKNELFVTTFSSGVWKRDISEVLKVDSHASTDPNRFSLEQNYPNPFNPTTVIRYSLPLNGFVTLKVFDVLGREVKTVVNEREITGTHSATFDGSLLSSGVYFYRLQLESYVQTKKLILIR